MKDQLLELGIRINDLIAGLAGGVVNAVVFKRAGPAAIVGSVLVGALTANYLGEPASKIVGLSTGAGSFITGLAAMAICQAIVEAVRSWKPSISSGSKP